VDEAVFWEKNRKKSGQDTPSLGSVAKSKYLISQVDQNKFINFYIIIQGCLLIVVKNVIH